MTEKAHTSSYSFYVGIWAALVILMVWSVLYSNVNPLQATMLAFTVAIMKAYLVVQYYMHLKFEPRYLLVAMLSAVLVVYILFGGIVSDVMYPPVEGPPIP